MIGKLLSLLIYERFQHKDLYEAQNFGMEHGWQDSEMDAYITGFDDGVNTVIKDIQIYIEAIFK